MSVLVTTAVTVTGDIGVGQKKVSQWHVGLGTYLAMTTKRASAVTWVGLSLSALLGCSGELAGPGLPGASGGGVAAGGAMVGGGATVGGGGAAGGTGGSTTACATPQPGRSPLRRLTRTEYDRTVKDLLGDETAPGARLLTADAGEDNTDVRTVGPLLAEQYFKAAEDVAMRAIESAAVLQCDTASVGELACAERIIDTFGGKAYRRPLPAADRARLLATYTKARAVLNYEESLEVVVTSMLQASRFLYRIEPSAAPGIHRLDGYSLATRLSYLFWGTTPDESLLSAAAAGKLDTDAGVLEQANVMAMDARASDFYASFFDRFLQLDSLSGLTKDVKLFPEFTAEMPQLFREETHAFIGGVMASDGSLRSLLTASHTMLNEPLARFYGVTPAAGSGFARVELDPARSAGLLTHASVLATHAKPHETSPVHRGMFVQASLLCGTVPPPPDDLDITAPDPDPSLTTRERFAEHRANPACAGCHRLLDVVGFGFEHYDAVGRYRELENGLPIDDSGELVATDVDGTFKGPRELGEKLAQSAQVQACFANHWFRFAQGRRETPQDQCSLARLTHDFAAASLDTRQLVLALTQTDAFLYKEFEELPPSGAAGGQP